MNKDCVERGSESDDQASFYASATAGERAVGETDAIDILRIIPIGGPAAVAFHQLAVKGPASEHHAQFIVITGKELLSATEGFDSELDEGDTVDSPSDEEAPVYRGYFRLNFDCSPLSKGVKWVLGRGWAGTSAAEMSTFCLPHQVRDSGNT